MYNLERFVKAQEHDYPVALREMREGHKRSHWIWYIFPQLKGLGRSNYAQYYGLDGIDEARAYLEHPVLGARLMEITEAILQQEESDPEYLMGGHPDDRKLKSCMTLFAHIAEKDSVFHRAIDKFFCGEVDDKTIAMF